MKLCVLQFLSDCWHLSIHESEAMWRLYAEWRRGVVVKTTVGSLKGCFVGNTSVSVKKIRYIDYERDSIDVTDFLSPYITKRKEFRI